MSMTTHFYNSVGGEMTLEQFHNRRKSARHYLESVGAKHVVYAYRIIGQPMTIVLRCDQCIVFEVDSAFNTWVDCHSDYIIYAVHAGHIEEGNIHV